VVQGTQTIEGYVGETMDDGQRLDVPVHWRVLALVAAGYFCDVLDFTIFGALVPDLIKSGFVTQAQVPWIGSATLLGLFIGTLVALTPNQQVANKGQLPCANGNDVQESAEEVRTSLTTSWSPDSTRPRSLRRHHISMPACASRARPTVAAICPTSGHVTYGRSTGGRQYL
jgi:hypothetical protein